MADLMKTIKEMNEKSIRKNVYIILAGGQIFASTAKYELDDYLKKDESLITPWTDLDDVSILYGFQLDPKKMPFELSAEAKKDRSLWLLYDDGSEIVIDKFDDLIEVTESIAIVIDDCQWMNIDDFLVVLGSELELVMTIGSTGTHIQERIVYD